MADLDLTTADFKRAGARRRRRGGRRRPPVWAVARPQAAYALHVSRAGGDAGGAGRRSASALLDRVIAAKGGLETLRAREEHHRASRARP